MATLHLKDVSKRIGSAVLLDSISVDIHQGEFMVVVGPSGSGKSTLLRMIAGLDTPCSGSIQINNRCVNDIPPAKRDMAMVFQSYALYPHMSVFDNMAYGLKLRGMSKEVISKKVQEVAELLRIQAFLQRKPSALSGGQKQRVAMGRAIVRSPAVYLFDEPLSNLDATLRMEMRHEIKRLHQRFQITSLYVTHDQTEAMTMACRVMVMNQGKLEQIGTPKELYLKPANPFVAGFIGHYPINFISGVYDKTARRLISNLGMDFDLSDWSMDCPDASELLLGIRPEDIRLSHGQQEGTIELCLDFVDDMGADVFIQAHSPINAQRMNIRIPSDQPISGGSLYVEIPKEKWHVFNKHSGKRLGGCSG